MLKTSTRTLLNSGKSLLTPRAAAERIFRDGKLPDSAKVLKCRDTDLLFERKNIQIGITESDDPYPTPELSYTEEEVDELLDFLADSARDDTSEDIHFYRLNLELQYFESIGAVGFLLRLRNLVQDFAEQGIVWGVGRGSSCASYVLFLLGVHDINPLKYDIPFNEFSKEPDDVCMAHEIAGTV